MKSGYMSIEEVLAKDWERDDALVLGLWWDWFCPRRQLPGRGKRLLRRLREIADSPRFDKRRYRTFFKNVCPGTDYTIDHFYIVPISDEPDLAWFLVRPPRRRDGWAELHAGPQGTDGSAENLGFNTWEEIRAYFLADGGGTRHPQPAPGATVPPGSFTLDREKLFEEIESLDVVCPVRESDGSLHLVAQELEESDCLPKVSVEQVVRFDEEKQTVVWEAFCPLWRVPDAAAAWRFVSDWMRHHGEDAVFLDDRTGRLRWRRSFWIGWVEDEDGLESLPFRYFYDAMGDCIECLQTAQLELGGF
jgi:hypothetical protein